MVSPEAPGPSALPQRAAAGWRQDGPRFAIGVWVVGLVAAGLAAVGVQVVTAVTVAVREALRGDRSTKRIAEIVREATQTSTATWFTLLASQAAVLACAWIALRVLGAPARERLGLRAHGLRSLHAAVLLAATILPFSIGLLAASLVQRVLGPPSPDSIAGFTRMWSEGSRTESVAWILTIALVPGFVEELFYRGLVLRGLLARWGSAASILVSSLLFAIAHVDPGAAAFTFAIGVWLGVVAWRTGSIALPFAMHAAMNGAWTAFQMVLARNPASEPQVNALAIGAAAIGACVFPWAVRLLRCASPITDESGGARPARLLPTVATTSALAAVLLFVIVPPGTTVPEPRRMPSLAEIESLASQAVECPAEGEVAFELPHGGGARVALPANRVGIDEMIVVLDAEGKTAWLAYGGERTGKGTGAVRPTGVLEQLASGDPTVVCMRFSQGSPPVTVRFSVHQDPSDVAAAWERARSEGGWASRGRN